MRTPAPRSYRIRRRNTALKAVALIIVLALLAAGAGMKMLDSMVFLHGH
jgi:hypothetical protein